MKFIISSSYLLKHLQMLGGVINSNNTLPILDNFLFDLDEGSLKVTASDLETTISAELTVDSTDKGVIAIPAKLLLDILKTFADQPLTFVVEENSTVEINAAFAASSIPRPKAALRVSNAALRAAVFISVISITPHCAENVSHTKRIANQMRGKAAGTTDKGGDEKFPGAWYNQVGARCDRPGPVAEPAPSRKFKATGIGSLTRRAEPA